MREEAQLGGLLERLLAAGPVRLYTLAPELPGALDLVIDRAREWFVSHLAAVDRPEA